jgi:hypothetical protein
MKTSSSAATEFTIWSANQTLPLIRIIVDDIVRLSREIAETRERLDYLSDGREQNKRHDVYSSELISIEQATDLKSERLDHYVQELIDLQVSAVSATQGRIDFPATRENESVCLCWSLGEQEVLYWHRANEDCTQRRLVDLPLIRQSGDRHLSKSV